MSTLNDLALKSAKGFDTEDWMNHIAWTDVVLPRITSTRTTLTKELVGAVLESGSTNKELIAGKIWGLDYVIGLISQIVREGKSATSQLDSQNIHLQ